VEQQVQAGLEVFFSKPSQRDVKPSSKPEAIPHLNVESGSKGWIIRAASFRSPLFNPDGSGWDGAADRVFNIANLC